MSSQTYLKVPFVWEEPKPIVEVPSRLKFKSVNHFTNDVLISTLVDVMGSSIDASDRNKISQYGDRLAAKKFLNSSKDGFSYQDEWWQYGVNSNEEIIGFVLPVIFEGGEKDNLQEGTIYYIGILPKFRGLGLSNDLLLKGTRILQQVGIWQVFCDTDANNIAMISTFKRVGYRQYGAPWERPL
jgi:ribosomal protein S18 acetylase RimI-like enzyme